MFYSAVLETQLVIASSWIFFRNLAKVSSSLQDMTILWLVSFPGGVDNKCDIANLISVEPSVRSRPYLVSNSDSLSLATLWTVPKVPSEILNPIVLIGSRPFDTSQRIWLGTLLYKKLMFIIFDYYRINICCC